MRLPLSFLGVIFTILPTALAVFADEAYHVDYHHELLGIPQPHSTFFHRPRKDDKGTLIYTLSDLGVLGAVNPGTGKVVWRQLLARDNGARDAGLLKPVDGESTVVSTIRNKVQSWDAITGRLRWEDEFNGTAMDLEILVTTIEGKTQDVLALFEENAKGVLRRLKGTDGSVAWEYRDTTSDIPLQVSSNVMSVFVVSLHGAWGGYNLKVTSLDPVTGKKTSEYTLGTKADIHEPEDVLFVGANTGAAFIAWADKSFKNLKVNVLGAANDIQNLPLKDSDGSIEKVTVHAPHLVNSLPHFLVHSQSAVSNRADVYHIDLKTGSIKKAYELPKLPGKSTFSTSCQDANVYFTRITETEVQLVSSVSHGILGRWPVSVGADHGSPLYGISEVVQRDANSYAVRSAIVTSTEDWLVVRNDAVAWSRPEGLSGIVAAQWAEIPESESLAKTLKAEAHSNPLAAYIHRVRRHLNDLQYLRPYLQNLPQRLLSSILPSETIAQKPGYLVRDNFGFNKLVIVATGRGRVYGLNAGNHGALVWGLKAFHIPAGRQWNVTGILVENAKGVATVRGGDGEYIIIETATGRKVEAVGFGTESPATATAFVDSPSGGWVLPISADGNPGEIPSDKAPKDIIVVKSKDGYVRGLKFEISGAKAVPVIAWTFQPPVDDTIVNVVARPSHDPIASIGRVLVDRTVLYKYLNPNLVLITTVSHKASTASFFLLDSVSGDVLYSTFHDRVSTNIPIPSVLTENWFAYSVWSDVLTSSLLDSTSAAKGYQLHISELYESSIPNDRGPLGSVDNSSSVEPSDVINAEPSLPHVISQSFIIPEPISSMYVTQTRQGITTRGLLCTLPASNSITLILRTVLDPLRPVGRDATGPEMEDGLFRYQPVIDFDPKHLITHKREVIGIRNVIAAPALLESTSLVFAYGIDVFGTRVAPSAAFDILGKTFNKLSLVGTVVALLAGVVAVAPLVRRKQINARWETS